LKGLASITHLRKVQTKGILDKTAPVIMMSGIVEIGLIAVLTLGVFMITNGSLSLSAAAALLVIISHFSEPLSLFSSITQVVDIVDAAFTKIKELLSIENLNVYSPVAVPETFDIEFDHVFFAYGQEEQYALKNVSFTIPAGKLTALVGPSGSGKTTITKMIMRYADPQAGAVKIGGTDLTHISQEDLMKNVSVVFQDVYLFDDTILNNIRMGNPDASDEQVKEAAKQAFCHEFINRLPDGYDTEVGDIGGALSGGEKQRISIARAVLKDAPIMMLDEPTAALDAESEVAVQGRYFSMWSAQRRVKEWNIAGN
jgi:ATP-binding cassette, subfamily B, bacterial IrtB/YbtQ